MTDKSKRKNRRGRPALHGGYSIIHRDALLKEQPLIRRYLEDVRAGLVADVSGGTEDDLSEQQRVMIDRIINRLAICRLIEAYCEKYGVFRRDQLKRKKILELEPALGQNYLAFSNSIDRALISLGLDRRKREKDIGLAEYVQAKDAEKSEKAKATALEGQEIAHPSASLRDGKGQDGSPEPEKSDPADEGQSKGKDESADDELWGAVAESEKRPADLQAGAKVDE
jgi:hypothetical protein